MSRRGRSPPIRHGDAGRADEDEFDARVQLQNRAAVVAEQQGPGATVGDGEVDEIAAATVKGVIR
jgi:hypothetical protein